MFFYYLALHADTGMCFLSYYMSDFYLYIVTNNLVFLKRFAGL